MKKISLFLALLSVMCLVSCTPEKQSFSSGVPVDNSEQSAIVTSQDSSDQSSAAESDVKTSSAESEKTETSSEQSSHTSKNEGVQSNNSSKEASSKTASSSAVQTSSKTPSSSKTQPSSSAISSSAVQTSSAVLNASSDVSSMSEQFSSLSTSTSTSTATSSQTTVNYDNEYYSHRGGLVNTYKALTEKKALTVAYLGGSITYGIGSSDANAKSFRALVTAWLRAQFPQATVNEVNAAIPSACSALGAYCVESDVISQKPDLVFLEYALNDKYASGKYTIEDNKAHCETIVRKILTKTPKCDIVFLYTTDSSIAMSDKLYAQAQAHDAVAEYYSLPSINIGWQLRTEAGLAVPTVGNELSQKWKIYFSDACHPADRGAAKYAEIIERCLSVAFSAAENGQEGRKNIPDAKNSALLMNTTYVKTADVDLSGSIGWNKATTRWSQFDSYSNGYIYTNSADNELSYTFTGSSFGILGPTNVSYTYSVDGGEWQEMNFNSHPNPLVSGLKDGTHTIKIKAVGASDSNTFSIAAFLIK